MPEETQFFEGLERSGGARKYSFRKGRKGTQMTKKETEISNSTAERMFNVML